MSHGSVLRDPEAVESIQSTLREMELDGWLLYEFRGQNPVARNLLGVQNTTRRGFVLVPSHGEPQALVHAIEGSEWRHWPWPRDTYAGWQEMEEKLSSLVKGRPRLALEVSSGSAVPTVDVVPWGLIELLRSFGVRPASSQDLLTRFHSTWSAEQLQDHRRAAEIVADTAADAFRRAAEAARSGYPTTEGELSSWIRSTLAARGVGVDADTHVAVGPGSADPHYAPEGSGAEIAPGQLLLIDLWGRTSQVAVPADQTWMGYLGESVPEDIRRVWDVVREARDSAVRYLRDGFAERRSVRGYEVDDVARGVIRAAGFGDYFPHRTGHSIDTRLHGSGPNLDNFESRDDRILLKGVGFSIEPGIYLPGRFGVRSEINVHWGDEGPEVTPKDPQQEVPALLQS